MGGLTAETRSRGFWSFCEERPGPENKNFEFAKEIMEKDGSPRTGLLIRSDDDEEEVDPWVKTKKSKNQVFLEGFVEPADDDDLTRTKSLTDEDLEELKGCLDLGFGFSYEEIPELCNTLPALELCYSMSQRFIDDHQKSPESTPSAVDTCSSASGPIANWKILSPGDHPEDVKARLKYWAQAVACTVRLCS